jgi:hypothetical protein
MALSSGGGEGGGVAGSSGASSKDAGAEGSASGSSSGGSSASSSSSGGLADASSGGSSGASAGDDAGGLYDAGDASTTDEASSAGLGDSAAPYADSGVELVSLFDGVTLTGWYYMDQGATWSVANGAIHGTGPTPGQIITAKDYGSFRLIATSRMVAPIPGACCAAHLGILAWGDRPPPPTSLGAPFLGSIEAQPPNGSMWDFQLMKDTPCPGSHCILASPRPTHAYTDWVTGEYLFDLAKGTLRMASAGVELWKYTDPNPARWKAGPIGLVLNKPQAIVEYKDLYIEENPTQDRLITVP